MKRFPIALWLTVIPLLFAAIHVPSSNAQSSKAKTLVAKGPMQQVNPYFSTQNVTYNDGTTVSRSIINGPHVPPPGYELERSVTKLPKPNLQMGTGTLTVPAFRWVIGCSAVSGAMIAGYYDRNGFPNMYTGPTNSGLMPLDDLSWSSWMDGHGDVYPDNPLIASHNGLDGRSTYGSIDDYWVLYGSTEQDPYVTESRTEHTWEDAVGDYMKTSQSAYGNTDGSTTFYHYTTSSSPLTCSDMATYGIHEVDGAYGRKLFYEARGYTVTDCYTQNTDNKVTGGFSFAQFKAEIDAGHPVMLQLEGHTVVGVGYDDSSNTVYLNDTWDNSTHSVTWGSDYAGMNLWGATVINLEQSGLLLGSSHFKVEVDWLTPTGSSGHGTAVGLTSDSGYFWFFENTNVELLVKIHDGCGVNNHYWFFYGALTDVEYSITVTDTQTNEVKTYYGTQHVQSSSNDTNAFACP
jgi:hypothetical protein